MTLSTMFAAGWLLATSAQAQDIPAVYTDAQVWNGAGFERRDLAVRDGRFVAPISIDPGAARISLEGRYVTPAYGNAHAHVTATTDASSRGFTDTGVFYVWNPNTVVLDAQARGWFGQAGRVSLKVAQGGITEPGGHPEPLYVDVLGPMVYGAKPREWFIGNAFHYGRTPAEIDAALSTLKQQGADFVKIYILNSEHYRDWRDDPARNGEKGLDPAHVLHLVRRAHALGLPVVAHLETAHDLKVAAEAGVDFAAHLPAYGKRPGPLTPPTRITPEIAALVAQTGMRVIPTYALANGGDKASIEVEADARETVEIQTENLRVLRAAGVQVLTGTDGFNQIFSEAEHLVFANGLSSAEATSIVLSTGAVLFPERRIGCFEPGCEADFLVLDADPTADIRALRRIERRVMGGRDLAAP